MALTSKHVTLDTVLNKVYADQGYDIEVSYGDAAQWAAEAMDLIGVPMAFLDKTATIAISAYRGKLPCDLHDFTMGGIIDTKTGMPLRANENIAYLFDRQKFLEDTNLYVSITDDNIDPTVGTFQIDKNGYPVIPSDVDYIRSRQAENYIYYRPSEPIVSNQDTYTFNNNFIFTSIKNGTLKMQYRAFPVDDNGFPLIPDDTKYIRAVATYITWKIDWKLFRLNKLSKDIVKESEKEWLWAVGSAAGKAQMLTLDEAESFKNMTVRLFPRYNEHLNSFKYLGEGESLSFKNML